MLTVFSRILCVLCLVVFSVACTGRVTQQRRDIARFESSLSDIRGFQAEQTTQITAINAELRELVGRIEKLELSLGRPVRFGDPAPIADSDGGDIPPVMVQPSLPDVGVGNTPPPIVPKVALESDEKLAVTLGREVAVPFSEALLRLRQGQFEEAIPLLRNAIDSSGANVWAANLLFWIGVANDGLGENPGALGAYNSVVTQFPRHDRTPLALYRQGQVFIRLRDSKAAALTFRKLIADYPRAQEAALARERLKEL